MRAHSGLLQGSRRAKVSAHPTDSAVRIHRLFLFPTLLLASCALDSAKDESDPSPAPRPGPTVAALEPEEMGPPKPADPGLDFAVPDSTGKLMSDDKKKTVTGPIVPPKPDTALEEEESVINVAPPLPPSVPPLTNPDGE